MDDNLNRPSDDSAATPGSAPETDAVPAAADKAMGLNGKTLGHYRLIEEIGHGGQGYVYLADDLKIHRQVALKILPQGHALSPSARLRFEREAETAGKLDHPGISRIYEFGEHEGISSSPWNLSEVRRFRSTSVILRPRPSMILRSPKSISTSKPRRTWPTPRA